MATEEIITEVKFFRGDSYAKTFTITDKDGNAIPISGWAFQLVVDTQKVPTDPSSEQFTVDGVIVDGNGGIVSFTPTVENNDRLEKTYYYRIIMTQGAAVRTAIRDKYIIM